MVAADEFEIRFVDAAHVRPLRREVLRVDMPEATVDFEGDDHPATFHLAVFDQLQSIIAVSSWMERPFIDDSSRRSIQLRGMATKVTFQSFGLGALLLEAGFRTARERSIDMIWANARDAALNFYLKNGFEIVGDGFIEEVTRLPHHRVRRSV
ncbi:MAG: GNAT family N-acetyltransferase [Actinomycetota bacterium]